MNIFLSYSSKDRDLAEEIQLALVGAGYKVFFDKISLPTGQEYHAKIREEVENADILIFLISHNSVRKGSYALTELKYHRDKWGHPQGRILPVNLCDEGSVKIPRYLTSVTYLSPEGNVAAEVLDKIEKLCNNRKKAEENVINDNAAHELTKIWNEYVNKTCKKDSDVFIDTQELLLLTESGAAAFKHLHVGSHIPGRDSEREAQQNTGQWKQIERGEILERMHTKCKEEPLHRIVITSDGGVGKTTNLKWFWKELSKDRTLAFYFVASEITKFNLNNLMQCVDEDFRYKWCIQLAGHLEDELRGINTVLPNKIDFVDLINKAAEDGNLVLIIDGLDQTLDEQSLQSLAHFLKKSNSRAILGGRLHSLATYKTDLELTNTRWRFIRICEFKEEEQEEYLGNQCLKIILDKISDDANFNQFDEQHQVIYVGEAILSHIGQDREIDSKDKIRRLATLIKHLIRDKKKLGTLSKEESDKYKNEIKYLGKQLLDIIPKDAQPLLVIPRILEMIGILKSDELRSIQTDCDVYYRATQNIVIQGLKESDLARKKFGSKTIKASNQISNPQVKYVHALFGAIAYAMTRKKMRLKKSLGLHKSREKMPNFDGVTLSSEVIKLKEEVIEKIHSIYFYSNLSNDEIEGDLNQLAALGTAIQYPIFDQEPDTKLIKVVWQNRSFQEFYTAYWLANYASKSESEDFKNWIFFHEIIESDWYYYINRFLAEMPQEALDKSTWIRSTQNWYNPNVQKRSTEMIYRSWIKMHDFAGLLPVDDWWNVSYQLLCQNDLIEWDDEPIDEEKSARDVLNLYWGEFQGILDNPKSKGQSVARSFIRNKLWSKIESGIFRMGSSKSNQGFPPKTKAYWEKKIQEVTQKKEQFNGEQLPQEIRRIAESCIQPEWTCGVQGAIIRQQDIDDLANALLESIDKIRPAIEELFRTRDESPDGDSQAIKGFEIHMLPVLNQTFRLFYPEHGEAQKLYLADFKEEDRNTYKAPSANHPVNYVSWYDSWAFCQWVRWKDPNTNLFYRCRLPHEPEWEYAAKGCTEKDGNSFPENQRYWWGNDFYQYEDPDDPRTSEPEHLSNKYAHADGRRGYSTRSPKSAEPNGFGLKDVLGNVWEWMANPYIKKYSSTYPSLNDVPSINCKRTMRGGLWYFLNLLSTCTQRYKLVCNDRDYKMGFRVIREQVNKGN